MTPPQPSRSPSRTSTARTRHRSLALTDDQYVATSLALVAKLALHLREKAPRHG